MQTNPNISLTDNNDTLITDGSLAGFLNGSTSSISLLNKVVDAGAGQDTFRYNDAFYTSPYFQLSVMDDGSLKLVATQSSASGSASPASLVLKNFETMKFVDVVLSLVPTNGGTSAGTGGGAVPVVDVLNGDSANNNLAGLGGDDWLFGEAGNDTLDGGAGNDTMSGQAGNDVYVVDAVGDQVNESASNGVDTVRVAIATAGGTYTLPSNIENGSLTNSVGFNLTGNGLANNLRGNAAANALVGGAGADTLIGGAGADTLTGGAGNDVFRFGTKAGAGNVDVVKDFASGDHLSLDPLLFTALGGQSGSALPASAFHLGATADATTDRILYDSASGKLYYDPTGSDNGTTDRVQIALVGTTTHPTLHATDFLVS